MGSINIVKTPPKIWRPKQRNLYKPLGYTIDINRGFFGLSQYSNTILNPDLSRKNRTINDPIIFREDKHRSEIKKV